MRGSTTAGWLLAAGLSVALAGCGSEQATARAGGAATATAEPRVPITEKAIAAIALEHVDVEATRAESTSDDPEAVLGANLRFRGDDQVDGDLLRVRLAREPEAGDDGTCGDVEECVMLDDDEGHLLRLGWYLEEPEEDPGGYGVTLFEDGRAVYAAYAGEPITGDPRDQDLEISVDDLVALLEDPDLDHETSPEAVAAGEALTVDWTDVS